MTVRTGTFYIPDCAGADVVAYILLEPQNASYTITCTVVSGTYSSVIQKYDGYNGRYNFFFGLIIPHPTNDLGFNITSSGGNRTMYYTYTTIK